jgi:exosortase A-associated hydrolase 1
MGMIVVVGGPQYRAGSHRQFVQLARHVASQGLTVLRFDSRGMGDSGGAPRDFEHLSDDIGSAVDALMNRYPTVKRVALWGLCDGASAALLYLHQRRDGRVAGLALLNPWVRSEASLARTQIKHYYFQRLAESQFWLKLASGKVAARALADLWGTLSKAFRTGSNAPTQQACFQQRMAQAWAAFEGHILLMLSDDDYTAREFEDFIATDSHWLHALAKRAPQRVAVVGADHTCSAPAAQRAVEHATSEWARRTLASNA